MKVKSFKIEVQEFLSQIIEIEAKNIEDAISKVKDMYRNEIIVLDKNDYASTEFHEFENDNIKY